MKKVVERYSKIPGVIRYSVAIATILSGLAILANSPLKPVFAYELVSDRQRISSLELGRLEDKYDRLRQWYYEVLRDIEDTKRAGKEVSDFTRKIKNEIETNMLEAKRHIELKENQMQK